MDGTTAFWGMTINNYTETDLALVQQGYPDFIRQLVYTLEVGKEGTPHIQGYIKLLRAQRLSYVKKLFPRAKFQFLSSDEYKLNAQRYAQKLDATATSPAVITNNPFPDPVVELTSVIESVMEELDNGMDHTLLEETSFLRFIGGEEHYRVSNKPALAKFYVSATYKNVKKQFWKAIACNISYTHAHTHAQDEIKSHQEGITNASSCSSPPSDNEHQSRATSRRSSWGTSVSSSRF